MPGIIISIITGGFCLFIENLVPISSSVRAPSPQFLNDETENVAFDGLEPESSCVFESAVPTQGWRQVAGPSSQTRAR